MAIKESERELCKMLLLIDTHLVRFLFYLDNKKRKTEKTGKHIYKAQALTLNIKRILVKW